MGEENLSIRFLSSQYALFGLSWRFRFPPDGQICTDLDVSRPLSPRPAKIAMFGMMNLPTGAIFTIPPNGRAGGELPAEITFERCGDFLSISWKYGFHQSHERYRIGGTKSFDIVNTTDHNSMPRSGSKDSKSAPPQSIAEANLESIEAVRSSSISDIPRTDQIVESTENPEPQTTVDLPTAPLEASPDGSFDDGVSDSPIPKHADRRGSGFNPALPPVPEEKSKGLESESKK